MKKLNSLLVFMMVLFFFSSCKKEKLDIKYERYTPEDFAVLSQTLNIENNLEDYTFIFPKYYQSRALSFDSDLATLGRVMLL